ncbi:hypothetical protein ACXGQW_02655 [Wenyingzhuangia sp. IMCC45533]
MKKPNYLLKLLLASIFCSSMFIISCSDDNGDDTEETFEEQSVSSAKLNANTSITGNTYKFAHVDNQPIELEVEDYNEEFTYSLEFTGDNFDEKYSIDLTKKNTSSGPVKGDGEFVKLSKTNIVGPISTTTYTTLVASVENLDMLSDTYSIQLLEKESNSLVEITGVNEDYVVVDNDATSFLSGTQLEDNNFGKLTELDLNQTYFRVRPTIVNFINGIGVTLGVYDSNLKLINTVNSNGSNGQFGKGTFSYRFLSSKVDELLQDDGTYYFRLEESKNPNDASDKVYKNAIFQKISVKKKSTLSDSNVIVAVKL